MMLFLLLCYHVDDCIITTFTTLVSVGGCENIREYPLRAPTFIVEGTPQYTLRYLCSTSTITSVSSIPRRTTT